MPKTKFENTVFTLITSGLMIFIMGVYNVAVHSGGLTYSTFTHAARSFIIEWIIGFLFALFFAGNIAKHFAFKVAVQEDRTIFIILSIQIFTVCTMVPFMSLVGAVEQNGITIHLPVIWLETVVLNFIMAMPLQIFVVGPLCRKLFRAIFRNN